MKPTRHHLHILAALVGLVAVVDVLLSYLMTTWEGSPGHRPSYTIFPSYTISESKSRGAFVEAVSIEPGEVDWHGRRVAVKEAWLEHRTELGYVIEIIPFCWEHRTYRKVAGYNLCLNLADGWDVLQGVPDAYFVAEAKGHAFAQLGTVVLWERVDTLAACPRRVLLTDNWKFEGSLKLTVKRAGD